MLKLPMFLCALLVGCSISGAENSQNAEKSNFPSQSLGPMSLSDIHSQLANIPASEEGITKGAVGVINSEVFILLEEEQNAAMLSGERWVGLKSSESQLIFVKDGRIFEPQLDLDLSKFVVISFARSEVRYIDFVGNRRGIYPRSIGQKD